MPEKETIFNETFKFQGIFSFKDFYKFCYDWLVQETDMTVQEKKYIEKVKGDEKEIDIEWNGWTKLTDYFKFDSKVEYKILFLKDIEVTDENGKKIKTNSGRVEMKIKGILVRDWQGKFEHNALQKMMRAIYEKWMIRPRIDEFEEKIFGDMGDFTEQAKAYLAIEGKQ
jgi:hypothetical protein